MTSAIVAVGDELVSGFILDTNSHWLAQQLRRLGRPVKRITAIRDRHDEIVEELRRCFADPEIEDVFTSGGLGPTPDDRTFEAVAAALRRELVLYEPALERALRRSHLLEELGLIDASQTREGNERMARIPAEPVHVFRNRKGMAPGLTYEVDGHRLFVLPGVPSEFRGIFLEELEPGFLVGRPAPVVRELRFRHAVEARFYGVMRDLEHSHPDVSVGSYPNMDTRELLLRASGQDAGRVSEAVERIRARAAALGLTPI
ncbi:MAG: competence/damage-inducible protein A [Candidatus Dormibacteraeota bacterium]|nr:competence/damage-inducible protein A [Candidatus Dormibacteraeota bacterium]MBO0761379.1 competence/damage-inducible protein A [Candidatus Dormibacteraeota bacterium]